jgi:hypothetical protein
MGALILALDVWVVLEGGRVLLAERASPLRVGSPAGR